MHNTLKSRCRGVWSNVPVCSAPMIANGPTVGELEGLAVPTVAIDDIHHLHLSTTECTCTCTLELEQELEQVYRVYHAQVLLRFVNAAMHVHMHVRLLL